MKKLGLAVSVVLLLAVAAQSQKPGPEGKGALAPTVYQKWLDEDVTYIIAPEEKAKFVALKDDMERDEFVRQFWLKRDPTAGTEENEFKEEHYRRIAYSNVHFVEKGAGWKSDRGRVYISLGPPDEITAGKDANGVSWEQWNYKGSESKIRFEDRCACGELKVIPMNWRPSPSDK
jgi:GWxTD domain-containing protein